MGSRETTPRLATRTAAATARMIRNVRVTRLACAIWIQASSLAASGFGRTRGAAFRLLEEFLRPPPPALGHPRHRKQPVDLVAITGVDAKHVPDGEIVPGSLDDPDIISRTHIALDDDSEVRPWPQCLGEAARKHLVVHPHAKPPARNPRLGHLENGCSYLPTLSDERVVDLDPFRREIFAELTVSKRATDVSFPPARVLDRVRVHCFVGSPVRSAIGLLVAGEIHTTRWDPTGHRRFPDCTLRGTTTVVELAHGADVDREGPSGWPRYWRNVTGPLTTSRRGSRPCKARQTRAENRAQPCRSSAR